MPGTMTLDALKEAVADYVRNHLQADDPWLKA